jgi:hypothetical protein
LNVALSVVAISILTVVPSHRTDPLESIWTLSAANANLLYHHALTFWTKWAGSPLNHAK